MLMLFEKKRAWPVGSGPTPGIPRQADGKPELTAPAPRTPDGKPDLSGLWSTEDNTYFLNLTGDLKPGETRSWA
jgi:hypothetical protein